MIANGQVVANFSASEFRQDLQSAGKGNGQHGFNFTPPASIKNGQNQALSLRVQGSSYIVPLSNRTITCAGSGSSGGSGTTPTNPGTSNPTATNLSNGNYEGYFEGADCGNLGGWVYDRNNPNAPVTVEMVANGQVTGSFTAANFRQDLQNAGKGNGQHGFNFAPPASIKNGQNQSISLRVQGSNYTLINGPKTIQCAGEGSSGGTGSNPETEAPATGSCAVANPRGNLDGADNYGIWGWAFDQNDLNKSVMVDIFVDGVKLGSLLANESRPDLIGAFNNNPAAQNHGFSAEWEIKPGSYNGPGIVTARICGSNDNLVVSSLARIVFDVYATSGIPAIILTLNGGTLPVIVIIKGKRPKDPAGDGTGAGTGTGSGAGTGTGTGSGSGNTGGTSGGSGAGNNNSAFFSNYIVLGPIQPIKDLKNRLDCIFGAVSNDPSYKYSATLYVDQPVDGTRDIMKKEFSVERRPGHTYFGLERYDSYTKQTVQTIMGFYVESELKAATGIVTTGAWGDDGGTSYDVALNIDLTPSQFKEIKYKLEYYATPNYNLVTNNCSSFAHRLLSPYINLPAGTGAIGPLGTGVNPADLGQDLRELANSYGNKLTIKNGSTSPLSTPCNNK